jgi:hypothetical protein
MNPSPQPPAPAPPPCGRCGHAHARHVHKAPYCCRDCACCYYSPTADTGYRLLHVPAERTTSPAHWMHLAKKENAQ